MDATLAKATASTRRLAFEITVAQVVVAAALAGGLALRLAGIGFGLPYEYHIDEQQYVRQAAAMGRRGFEPTWWSNPPFYKYVLFTEYAALYVGERATGVVTSAADFGERYQVDASLLFLMGRVTTAVLGVLAILLAYLLGKQAYSAAAGAVAAVFVSVCFLHVRESHFAVNDAVVTTIMLLAMLAAVQIATHGGRRWYIIGGVAAGIGFATKYTAIAVLLPLLLAWLLAPRSPGVRPALREPALLLSVTLLSAVIASPYFVLAAQHMLADVNTTLVEPLAVEETIAPRLNLEGFAYYLETLWWGMGPVFLLSLGGMAVAAVRRRAVDIVLLAFVLSFYVFMARQGMYFVRWILPLAPVLAVLAGDLSATVVQKLPARLAGLALAALVGLAAVQPLVNSVRFDVLLQRTDTRSQAKVWIEQHIPDGSRIAMDWPTHGPALSTAEAPAPASKRTYDVLLNYDLGLPEHTIEWYREQGYRYLVSSSYIESLGTANRQFEAQRQLFYNTLDTTYTKLAEFNPFAGDETLPFIFDELYGPTIFTLWQREQPGPRLRIYELVEKKP